MLVLKRGGLTRSRLPAKLPWMDADRLRAGRRRLTRAWVYGGLVWSTFFLLIAAGVVWLLGVPGAQTVQLALTFALVACGGLYAIMYFGAALIALGKWAFRRHST